MTHVLLLILLGTGYWQRAPLHGDRVHEVYRSRHDKVVGEYLQTTKHGLFLASCAQQPAIPPANATAVTTEKEARRVVEACPEP